MLYRHTQQGRIVLALSGLAAVVMAVALLSAGQPLFLLTLVPVVAVATVFSRMTIEVDAAELRHCFGLGFWRKRVPVAEILDASRTTSTWVEGWGIRVTFRGMLYNVEGTRAVELRLRSGRSFRLGTDEPDVLLAALRQAGVPTRDPSDA